MKKIIKYLIVIGALLIAHPHDFFAQKFVHPGGLATQDDFARIQYLLNIEKDPTITAAFNNLKANGHAQFTNTPNAQPLVERFSNGGNYTIAMRDVATAYQNALMWRITEDVRHADCAVRILNAWAGICTDIGGDTNGALASGIYGYEFAQAGELMRGYSGWKPDDFKKYQSWMRNMWGIAALSFLDRRFGHNVESGDPGAYFSNWGLANAFCVMGVGLLCDDVALYNEGLSFYKEDKAGNFTDAPRDPIKDLGYNEFLGNLVCWLHPDPRGPYGFLGQMQESGRDQGHATMAAGLAVDICQTAWNQGEDLYGAMKNRIGAGIEYVAMVNSMQTEQEVRDSVPFINYERSGMPTENYTATQIGLGGMGSTRPYWDRVLAHYEGEMGVPMKYSRKMALKTGIDGGGGNYSSNSGGYDHLGFSTITNYRPSTWYPAPGHYPVNIGTSITYKGVKVNGNSLSGVIKDSLITLTPTLPEGVADAGTWNWDTGETTRELTFRIQKSGIYHVTYTAPNGTKSKNTFNIAVWGDCTPENISYGITVGAVTYNDTVLNVLPFQSFTLSINTRYIQRGNAKWSTGAAGFSTTISNGVNRDSTFWVDHYNRGGYRTRINFHVKVQHMLPSISVDGGTAVSTNSVNIELGQSVEFKPVTTVGFDGGTFRWSTGHTSKSLMILNVQKAKRLTLYYTLTKNNVTTIDTIEFRVSVKRLNFQMANGGYYIQNATDKTYLTNTNTNTTDKIKPTFNVLNPTDVQSQIWTITKETAANAAGRFKIVSKKDGNYVNETGGFGINPYFPDWNTFTFNCLDGENLYTIQNGGNAGTKFWTISGNGVNGSGSTTQPAYPFLITPVVAPPVDTTTIPGAGVISYIAPAYSINGAATQRGDTISILQGKSLILKPVKVVGISGGTWLWSDNTTGSTLSLANMQNSGTYSVKFTYPEADTVYVFTLKYTVKMIPSTGIEDVNSTLAKIYPNPVQDILTLDLGVNADSDATFDLYSIDGRKLKSVRCLSGVSAIAADDLPQGLYIGLLQISGKTQTFKITKK